MAELKIPSADNPFSVAPALGAPSKSGITLTTPKTDLGRTPEEMAYQQKVDDLSFRQAVNDMKEYVDGLANDDGGWKSQTGINAIEREGEDNLADEFHNRLNEWYQERAKGMNPRIAGRFAEAFKTFSNSQRTNINRHVTKQVELVGAAESEREANMALSTVATTDDPVERKTGLMVLKGKADEIASQTGKPADYPKFLGPAYESIISNYVDAGDWQRANATLKSAVKNGFMSPQQAKSSKASIEKVRITSLGLETAEKLIAKYDPTSKNPETMQTALLKELENVKDPKVKKAAEIALRNGFKLVDGQLKDAYKAQEQMAWTLIRSGMNELPAQLRTDIEQSGNYKLLDNIDKFLERKAKARENRTSNPHVAAMLHDLKRDDPDAFIEAMSTDKYRFDVSEKLWQSFQDTAARLSKDRDRDSFKSFHKELNEYALLNGFKDKKWDENREMIFLAADRLYYRAKELKKDGYITPEERKKIVKEVFTVTDRGFFGGVNAYRWQDIKKAGGVVGDSLRWEKSVIQDGTKENKFIEAQFAKIGKTPADASANQVKILNGYVKSGKFPKELVTSANKKLTDKYGKAPTEKQINDYILQAVMADKISDK